MTNARNGQQGDRKAALTALLMARAFARGRRLTHRISEFEQSALAAARIDPDPAAIHSALVTAAHQFTRDTGE